MNDLDLRMRIGAFTAERIGPADLESWIAGEAADLSESEPATRQLAMTALRLLAEQGNGDMTETDLREQLGAFNRFYWFGPPKNVVSGSGSVSIAGRT